jgi:hypothetical protein
MVFPAIRYCPRNRLCGASGLAADLVAATNVEGMEDRTDNRNSCSQLGLVRSHDGGHSYSPGVLRNN